MKISAKLLEYFNMFFFASESKSGFSVCGKENQTSSRRSKRNEYVEEELEIHTNKKTNKNSKKKTRKVKRGNKRNKESLLCNWKEIWIVLKVNWIKCWNLYSTRNALCFRQSTSWELWNFWSNQKKGKRWYHDRCPQSTTTSIGPWI